MSRVLIRSLNPMKIPAKALFELKNSLGVSISELKNRLSKDGTLIDVELFDHQTESTFLRLEKIMTVIGAFQLEVETFELPEIPSEEDCTNSSNRISLDILSNIISSSRESLNFIQEYDDLKYGGSEKGLKP